MICLLLGWPCWILTNYKSSQKFPAGQLSQISSVISSEPKNHQKNLVLSMISGFTIYGYQVATGLLSEASLFFVHINVFLEQSMLAAILCLNVYRCVCFSDVKTITFSWQHRLMYVDDTR